MAGRFASVDAVPASNVACQTTSGWTQAGDGLTGVVHALAFANDGRLIAGGTFTVAGGANVAVLGASTWTALGGGVAGTDPDVRAIKIDGDAIIVGGAFDTPVKNLARFSQGTWSGPTGEWFAAAMRPIVSDVAVKSDGVYIVGTFERIGDVAVSHIARWSTTIEPVMPTGDMPLGVNGRINALLRDTDGSIIAGGQFVAAGTLPALNVARFADGRWQSFGAILDQVTAFARTDTIYAGTKTGNVLRWTGTDWTSIGALNGTINAMLEYNGDLIVAGDFTTPNRIARWTVLSSSRSEAGFHGALSHSETFTASYVPGCSFRTT